ncbi:hypothetical protein O181_035931 [Austropuccinia psidii MF-1]|uniref:Uncharacterized protein n=1 Tax=Austropuccinia psidii MF-1 TaxID=1389203 RepID=A0A9Q3D3H3_9BASI|nr:hypothetical protein [Austropuccinia psidii MF-1]
MLADKHTRNARLLCDPSYHAARRVPAQDALARTPLWPISNGHLTPSLERSDYLANKGWRWREDIQAWANCHHVLSHMGLKRQSKFPFSSLIHFRSRNHTAFFALHIEQNPPNPPQQDSPIQCMPCKQTLRQPTPGPRTYSANPPNTMSHLFLA